MCGIRGQLSSPGPDNGYGGSAWPAEYSEAGAGPSAARSQSVGPQTHSGPCSLEP